MYLAMTLEPTFPLQLDEEWQEMSMLPACDPFIVPKKRYSLRILLDHIHVVATMVSLSVTLLVRTLIKIPLPHLQWDILLTPESQ